MQLYAKVMSLSWIPGSCVLYAKAAAGAKGSNLAMADRHLIVGVDPWPPELVAMFREQLPGGFHIEFAGDGPVPAALLAEAEFIVANWQAVPRAVIEAAPRLRLIQKIGVGYDKIDLEAARERGVMVAIAGGTNAVAVAELTILLMLAVGRHLVRLDQGLRRGQWLKWAFRHKSYELWGKNLGVVGFGRIGREVARRAAAFGMRIAYYDPVPPPPEAVADLDAEPMGLEELLEFAHVLTLHVPLTPETRGLLNRERLERLRPGAILINAARGGLVDEDALYDLLKSGHLAGAGLDVFAQEPPPADHPLFSLDNVVVTPHAGGGTRETMDRMIGRAVENITRVAAGGAPHAADIIVPAPKS